MRREPRQSRLAPLQDLLGFAATAAEMERQQSMAPLEQQLMQARIAELEQQVEFLPLQLQLEQSRQEALQEQLQSEQLNKFLPYLLDDAADPELRSQIGNQFGFEILSPQERSRRDLQLQNPELMNQFDQMFTLPP